MGRNGGNARRRAMKPTMTRRGQRSKSCKISKRRNRTKGTASEKGGGNGEEKGMEEAEEEGEREKQVKEEKEEEDEE